jgi:hypothetical protein
MHQQRTRRRRFVSVAVAAVLLTAGLPGVVAAIDDVEAPVGTVTIGDGSGYAASLDLAVHIPATDDVGVVSVAVFLNGVPAGTRPYQPDITVTVPQAQLWDIGIQWIDGVANSSVGHASVQVDTTAPHVDFLRFWNDPDPTDALFPASIGNAWDDGSPIANVRFRTGSGAWGAPMPATSDNPMVIDWPAFDPVYGGSPRIGTRTVSVSVQNAAGLWSPSTSETMSTSIGSLSVEVSGDLRTGHAVTITPSIPDGLDVSPGGCDWELRWGNNRSLDDLDFDETFGGMHFMVPGSAGGCGPWTFTLPWVPVRQFDVIVSIYEEEGGGGFAMGARGHARFTAGVDSTERRILSSNLPTAQVLPSTYTPIVGSPITYTRYLLGGAGSCCDARWTARLGKSENPIQWTQTGGSTFTFTPHSAGDLFVGWDRFGGPSLLSAYYDPPVRDRDSTAPTVSAPTATLALGTVGDTVPISVTWTGRDTGWGISLYQLQESVNGGTWSSVALPSPTVKTVVRRPPAGQTLRYRVRAKDKAGHYSSWATGPSFRVSTASDSNAAMAYVRTWTLDPDDPTALGGSDHESIQSGAGVSFRFSARDLGWIAERGPGHGKAKVYIDGAYVATIDLDATSLQPRKIVFQRHWSTLGTHTIRVVGQATSGRPLITFDGIAILR